VEKREHGGVLISVNRRDQPEVVGIAKKLDEMGFKLYATEGTAHEISQLGTDVEVVGKLGRDSRVFEMLEAGKIDYVILTGSTEPSYIKDFIHLNHRCVQLGIPCLTSLDTATRLARYMFQEFWLNPGETPETVGGFRKTLCNKYVSTVITVVIGLAFGMGGWAKVWPLFGAANQLLAGIALLAVCAWLGEIGKNNKMFYIPMCFMLLATLTSLVMTISKKFNVIGTYAATHPDAETMAADPLWGHYFQLIFAAAMVILAVILVIEAIGTFKRQSARKAAANA
jgi:carbon starvation protein CstA